MTKLSTADVRTIAELPFVAAAAFGDRVAIRSLRGDRDECTFAQLPETVAALAGGLVEAGVAPGDRICLLGELTPTLKVKRTVVRANHAEAIESLYA